MCDDTPARILATAGPIFAEKGYQNATVREICQAANVNLASVNYYFGDKEKLYIESVKRARQLRAEQAPMPEMLPDVPAEDRLKSFVHTMLTRLIGVSEAPWQSRLMMREILSPTKACQEMVEEYFRPEFNLLMNIFQDLLPANTATHTRQQLCFSVVGQCLFYRFSGDIVRMLIPADEYGQHYAVEQLSDHISNVILSAVGKGTCWSAERERREAGCVG